MKAKPRKIVSPNENEQNERNTFGRSFFHTKAGFSPPFFMEEI